MRLVAKDGVRWHGLRVGERVMVEWTLDRVLPGTIVELRGVHKQSVHVRLDDASVSEHIVWVRPRHVRVIEDGGDKAGRT